MAAPLTFNAFTGWVDATDPNNIPPGLRLITASDLNRYEVFFGQLRDRINAHETSILANTPAIAALNNTMTTVQGNITTLQGNVTTLQGQMTTANTNIAALTRGVSVTSAATVNMVKTNYAYIHTGAAATFNLPPIAGNTGVEFAIKNRGTGLLTVQAETNKIYQAAISSNLGLTAGINIILINDGTFWVRIA
jgi:hypothetical protein